MPDRKDTEQLLYGPPEVPKDTRNIAWPLPPKGNVRLHNYLLGIQKQMDERLKYVEGVPPQIRQKAMSESGIPYMEEEASRIAGAGTVRSPHFMDPGEEGFGLLFAAPIAYHGSPYKFDKFTTEKIGTGQGAQAYGHGLYFAENPEVAKTYVDMPHIKRANVVKFPDEFWNHPSGNDAITRVQKTGSVDDALKEISEIRKYYESLEKPNALESSIPGLVGEESLLKKYKNHLRVVPTGNKPTMYKADISPPAEKFLDWDKPLSEQNQNIRKAVEEILDMEVNGRTLRETYGMALGADRTTRYMFGTASELKDGASFVDFIQHTLKKNQKEVAELLQSKGIPGIRYLDQGSRQSGKGTYNYVVFNENDVKILERK